MAELDIIIVAYEVCALHALRTQAAPVGSWNPRITGAWIVFVLQYHLLAGYQLMNFGGLSVTRLRNVTKNVWTRQWLDWKSGIVTACPHNASIHRFHPESLLPCKIHWESGMKTWSPTCNDSDLGDKNPLSACSLCLDAAAAGVTAGTSCWPPEPVRWVWGGYWELDDSGLWTL